MEKEDCFYDFESGEMEERANEVRGFLENKTDLTYLAHHPFGTPSRNSEYRISYLKTVRKLFAMKIVYNQDNNKIAIKPQSSANGSSQEWHGSVEGLVKAELGEVATPTFIQK